MIYPVPPVLNAALQYSVQLNDNPYTLYVYYQPFGKRLYFKINDQAGNLIVNMPLIPEQNMLAGYFTTNTMYYSPNDQTLVVV